MCHGGEAKRKSEPCVADVDSVAEQAPAESSKPSRPPPLITRPSSGCSAEGGPHNAFMSNWMAALVADSQPLAEVTLPGTHNSASWAPAAFVAASQCQARDLSAQLQMGVRFLDLRVRPGGGLCHGVVSCGTTLVQALEDCTAFLRSHPQEALVVRVKDESKASRRSAERVDELMRQLVESGKYPFFVQRRLPEMREVRGRIVLLCDWAGARFGIPWGGDLLSIQDEYRCKVGEDKWKVVEPSLRLARPSEARLRVDFTSATALPSRGPLAIARVVNRRLADFLRTLPCPSFLGMIVMDFPTPALCELIVRRNRGPHQLGLDRPIMDASAERWLTTLRSQLEAVAARADAAQQAPGSASASEGARYHRDLKEAVRQVARVYTRFLTERSTAELRLPAVDEPSPQQAARQVLPTGSDHKRKPGAPRVKWSGPALPSGIEALVSPRARIGSGGFSTTSSEPLSPTKIVKRLPLDADISDAKRALGSQSPPKTRRMVVKKFTASIKRREVSIPFGLQVIPCDQSRLLVQDVDGAGAVAQHNRTSPETAILPGDYILAVNGVEGEAQRLLRSLQASSRSNKLTDFFVWHPVALVDGEGPRTGEIGSIADAGRKKADSE